MRSELKDKSIFNKSIEFAYKYMDNIEEQSVYPENSAIENLDIFDEELSDNSTAGIEIIDKLHRFGSPATIAQIGGMYFGFVNGSIIPVALAARWLADTWDQNAAMYVSSPIASKLEQVAQNWIVDLLKLPEKTVMGLVSGTSTATFIGLVTARNAVLKKKGWNVNEDGLFGAPKIRVIISEGAHSSVFKALALLGIGMGSVERIPTDDQGRILTAKIPELDDTSILILQAGNVNTGAFDDFREIYNRANGAWIHIDGAFGLWVAASSKLKYLTDGIDLADSWSVDGHKTLNTPYDCGIILCKHEYGLVSAMQATGSYLKFSEKRDGMLYVAEMSRRARSVDLWASLKFLGKNGVSELVEGFHDLSVELANLLTINNFIILNEIVFNQVLVSCKSSEKNSELLDILQKSGQTWMGDTVWRGQRVIRVSICSWATTKDDINSLVNLFVSARLLLGS